MIRSMTGYGSASLESETLRAAVAVRSVNHRFLDASVHLPRRLTPLEAEAKEQVARAVARGRVEVSVQAHLAGGAEEAVSANSLDARVQPWDGGAEVPLKTWLDRWRKDLEPVADRAGGLRSTR